ncbi:glycosyltransferase [Streptomyces sp. P9(2023)]|uniref:glycosyltransferase n=1 Tax=Streptomyces sp. P9(2023) TaxID=3064394 RepID=UPI0028F42C14|nr:glycosyltransferase [Streptomyces sp. P9(2023)]MDT9692817.1 glycosyltransferase [Streptomyces sp. P9(2023)]
MNPRSVLIVAPRFPPDDNGPATRHVWHLARLLNSRHDYRVVVAAASQRGTKPRRHERHDGMPVYRLAAPGTPPALRWGHDLRRIIETEQVDLVDAHASAPLLAAAAARACRDLPLVLTCHDSRPPRGPRIPAWQTILAPAASQAREIVCVSDATAHLPGVLAARATAIGHRTFEDALGEPSWEDLCDRTVEVFDRAADPGRRARTVAIIAPYYAPHIGGVEHYAHRVAQAVAADPGMRAAVITASTTGWRTSVGVEDGVPVVRLGTWTSRYVNTPVSPLWPFQLRRWLRRLHVDVVHAHAPVPGLGELAVAVSGKRPAVMTYHAGTMVKGDRFRDRLLGCYERNALPRVFARTRALVAVSPASLASGRPGALEITPGVDVERFTPGPKASTRPRTILFVGRLDRASPWKGVDVLLRAFAVLAPELPEARLRLVGGGDAAADHAALAEHLGITDRVEFTGPLTGSPLIAEMRNAAVLVLPSLTAAESFGMVLVEAMACATPVVGSDAGGIPYVITDHVTGLIVPRSDPHALAAACTRVLRDGDLADRLGAAGRQRAVQRYAWPALTDRYLDLFRSLHPTPTGG